MPVTRHFLGWDTPLPDQVRAFLLPDRLTGPADLEGDLIIVPTRQAGRRLREALARHCADQHTALLSCRVVTAEFLIEAESRPGAASAALVQAAWATVLAREDVRQWRYLFPVPPPERTLDWALRLGARLQQLRETLADGGWRIADVPAAAGTVLEEPERWQDLARLEDAYLQVLTATGSEDPCARKLQRAGAPDVPPQVRRIILAGVPDPSGLAIRALDQLARQMSVIVLIHAPPELADHFDDWGRPLTEKWTQRRLDIPDPERNIRSAATPACQAAEALAAFREEAGRFDAAQLALGVPDAGIVPFLETTFAEAGLPPFNPADLPLSGTALHQTLAALCRLHTADTYDAFSHLVRQADVLDFLQRRDGPAPRALLGALDQFHQEHLPQTWRALQQLVAALGPKEREGKFAPLAQALPLIAELLTTLEGEDPLAAVRRVLQTLYTGRAVAAGDPEDRRFADAAARVDDALHEVSALPAGLCAARGDRLALLLHRLADAAVEPLRTTEVVDLEGWLELPWHSAPLMIITGMNEGKVPASRLGDLFLPDSLRHCLKLRDNASRYARDLYLLASLLAARRAQGRVVLICGRTSAEGDPLKPSRLLFRCGDRELADRVERLLGEVRATPRGGAPRASFQLNPCPDGPPDTAAFLQQPFHVTAFRDYLECPFRFYLKRVLQMEVVDDQDEHLDARGFGNLLHAALQRLFQRPELRACDQADVMARELSRAAAEYARRQYGSPAPPMVALQLDAAVRRLEAAARIQAELARAGWEVQACEQNVSFVLDGVTIRARVDRIDRHRKSGLWRIMDYKSADQAMEPPTQHLRPARDDDRPYALADAGKKRWQDLQLPLYLHALPAAEVAGGRYELAYFNLPKATAETGVSVWAKFDDTLRRSAEDCARGVLADVRAGRFWPPAETLKHDDPFERLFTAPAEECLDARHLMGS